MGMSNEDRAWLEGRLRDFREDMRTDAQAMEGRIIMRIADIEAAASRRFAEHEERLKDHEGRIRQVEITEGKQAGQAKVIAAIIGGLITGAVSWFWQQITGGRS